MIALEYDPAQREKSASGGIELDKLFYIDDGFILKSLNKNEEGVFESEVICGLLKALPAHLVDRLYDLRRGEFQRVSVTQDSITIDEVSINLRSNNVWKFKYGDVKTGWKALEVSSDDTCFR